jgi:hypothetical protein
MSISVTQAPVRCHPVFPDTAKPAILRAKHLPERRVVRNPDDESRENDFWQQRIGTAIARAVSTLGWTHDIAAQQIGVDASEFGKWLSGARRPHLDKLFKNKFAALRRAIILELAKLDDGIEITTEIRLKSGSAAA